MRNKVRCASAVSFVCLHVRMSPYPEFYDPNVLRFVCISSMLAIKTLITKRHAISGNGFTCMSMPKYWLCLLSRWNVV